MVTVEFAAASLIAVAALVFGGWIVATTILMGECQTTANEVARQRARGDVAAVAGVEKAAPPGARVTLRAAAGQVEVTVSKESRLGPLTWPVTARAVVLVERP